MPDSRQTASSGSISRLWPSGGVHLWPSGGTSPAHSHRRGHLVYAARGVLAVHTERGTSIVPANRVAWTPAGYAHYHRAHGHTDMRILFLPVSLARLLPDDPVVFAVSDLARAAVLTLTGPRGYDAAASDLERGPLARIRRVLVDELHHADEQPLHLPEPRDDRLQAIARLLYEQPANNAPLAELGRRTGASARTLSRLLHDELGITFYQWRTQLRIYHALVLLAEGHDTANIAQACGWANSSHFITAFANTVGTTPGRYRSGRERGDIIPQHATWVVTTTNAPATRRPAANR